jgi:hypothetical protein
MAIGTRCEASATLRPTSATTTMTMHRAFILLLLLGCTGQSSFSFSSKEIVLKKKEILLPVSILGRKDIEKSVLLRKNKKGAA